MFCGQSGTSGSRSAPQGDLPVTPSREHQRPSSELLEGGIAATGEKTPVFFADKNDIGILTPSIQSRWEMGFYIRD